MPNFYRAFSRLLPVITGLLLAPQAMLAQPYIVGVSWNTTNSAVWHLDITTGEHRFVGLSGFGRLNSLAEDSSGRLFSVGGANQNQLVRIDPLTGLGFAGPTLSFTDVRALAFSPAGQLFAVQDGAASGTTFDRLWTVDVNTGAGTLVGGINFSGVQGLDFSPDNILYGWDVGTGSGIGAGLIIIDPATGAASDVDPSVTGTGIQGLAFSTDNFYGAGDGLYSIDPFDGRTIPIGQRQFQDIRGIAVVPEPGATALFISGLIAAVIFSRRRQRS